MTDVDHDITPALPVADTASGPTPVDFTPVYQPGPTFVVPATVEAPNNRHLSNLPHCSSEGDVRDSDQLAPAQELAEPEDGIRFQTYYSDLRVLRDVIATLLPAPVATDPGVEVGDTSVPCEVATDGLHFTFCNGPISCRVQVPFANGTMLSGAGRFSIPAQIMRLAALQIVKNKPKPKKPSTRPKPASRSLAPRAIYQGVPDKAAQWVITPKTSSGQLLYGGTDLNFAAPTDTSMQWGVDLSLNGPVQIFPDRISAALRSTKPAAATRIDALPRHGQVAIDGGVACASNLRMYAFHSDTALDGLSLRIAESEISTLTSLMRHLDSTSTTIRISGRTCIIEDARLAIRFDQPFDTFSVATPRSSLRPTLSLQCEHSEITRLVTIASIIARSDADARRRLQLCFRIALIDGQLVLKANTAWGADRCENRLSSIIMEPEQAIDLRRRLSLSHSQARDNAYGEAGEALEHHEQASAIELGRYVALDLLRAIGSLRSGLLHFEFIEDKALIVSETMAQHRADYILVSGTQDDTHGIPQRRSKRWDAPPRSRF